MTTVLSVFGLFLLFCAVYLLVCAVSPRCPHCDGRMKYQGEDESGREVWKCRKCKRIEIV